MALPVIDSSVSIEEARNNLINYISNCSNIEQLFRTEQMLLYIKEAKLTKPRKAYLLHTLKLHKL